MTRCTLKIRYEGGIADEHLLSLYDGTASIHGVARAVQLATHALLHKETISKAPAARGARFYLKPARQGSVLFDIVTVIEQYPAMAAITAPIFYDFIKIVWQKATGINATDAETARIKRWLDRDEPFFDETAEILEGSLQSAHRAINEDVTSISIERPRAQLVVFDQETSDWVNTAEEVDRDIILTGNVTRYNSNTRNGRAYIDQLNKTIPFKPGANFPGGRLPTLTWSLHGSNSNLPKKIEFTAREIKSSHGRTKRIVLSDCRNLE